MWKNNKQENRQKKTNTTGKKLFGVNLDIHSFRCFSLVSVFDNVFIFQRNYLFSQMDRMQDVTVLWHLLGLNCSPWRKKQRQKENCQYNGFIWYFKGHGKLLLLLLTTTTTTTTTTTNYNNRYNKAMGGHLVAGNEHIGRLRKPWTKTIIITILYL